MQYPSQQFVDQLCSAEGLKDPLVREIERVVFDSHSDADRLDATSFEELLDRQLQGARTSRVRHVETISKVSEAMTVEQARRDGLPALTKDREEKSRAILKDEADMRALMPKGDVARAKLHDQLSGAVDMKRAQVLNVKVKLEALQHLTADVKNLREHQLPDLIQGLRQDREEATLSSADWEQFRLLFAGDVDAVLTQRMLETRRPLQSLEGEPVIPAAQPGTDLNISLLGEQVDLTKHPLNVLERELERLRKLVGMDAQNARRFKTIADGVSKGKVALAKVDAEIAKGMGRPSESKRCVSSGVRLTSASSNGAR